MLSIRAKVWLVSGLITAHASLHTAVMLFSIFIMFLQWLLVQKLWNNLEAVFNTPKTVQDFSGEAVKFASTHKRWIKLMRRAHEAKNILQCCFGSGEVSQSALLTEIRQRLEECRKSLSSYLQSKRERYKLAERAVASPIQCNWEVVPVFDL